MKEPTDSCDDQYLTFTLEKGLYALSINHVREVLEYVTITRMPRTPEYICGVINLRGHAVPVVDLKIKFGLGQTEKTVNTCIIITEVNFEGDQTVFGILSDSVREVYEMDEGQIESPPNMGTAIRKDFIVGMGRSDEVFIIILDINKVFSSQELAVVLDAVGQDKAPVIAL